MSSQQLSIQPPREMMDPLVIQNLLENTEDEIKYRHKSLKILFQQKTQSKLQSLMQ